jgi:hypothetical protein
MPVLDRTRPTRVSHAALARQSKFEDLNRSIATIARLRRPNRSSRIKIGPGESSPIAIVTIKIIG